MGDEKFLLTLEVAGRKYPLKIKRSEEEAFRYAAKKIKYENKPIPCCLRGRKLPHDNAGFYGNDRHTGIG